MCIRDRTRTWVKLHKGLNRPELIRPVGNSARLDAGNPEIELVRNPEYIHPFVRDRVNNSIEVIDEDQNKVPSNYKPENYVEEMVMPTSV